ncbi:beta-lactamase/transpeptidase-like protein [Panaeolus papilionaceus]|nr:beta-lactamase/transpeptidase-like protein [Panaeolus papilionaceus]
MAHRLLLIGLLASLHCGGFQVRRQQPTFPSSGTPLKCPPPSPKIFEHFPVDLKSSQMRAALSTVSQMASAAASQPGIDSMVLAIVGPGGVLFEKGYGTLQANETNSTVPDRNSIYRIGSTSKMFTVLETLMLRERGALSLDDPVHKYFPEFNPPSYGWANRRTGGTGIDDEEPHITIRELASHMSGLGRDWPPQTNLTVWPTETPWDLNERGPPKTFQRVMDAVASYPLSQKTYNFPIYSNTGVDILGLLNVVANQRASPRPHAEPSLYGDLITKDIFGPLGFTGSFFEVPNDAKIRKRVAVPSVLPNVADWPFDNAEAAAGAQYSSTADLEVLMQNLLDPKAKGKLLPQRVMREWLRPLHVWPSGDQGVGAPWEISKVAETLVYGKGGDVGTYHADFDLVPDYSYGIILLFTGPSRAAHNLVLDLVATLQPTFRALQEAELVKRFVGTWKRGTDTAKVINHGEALYLGQLVIGGIDVVKFLTELIWGPGATIVPFPMWSTGRLGEFRLALGGDGSNSSCWDYWTFFDPGIHSRDAPLDLLYWSGDVLVYPSSGVSFTRSS